MCVQRFINRARNKTSGLQKTRRNDSTNVTLDFMVLLSSSEVWTIHIGMRSSLQSLFFVRHLWRSLCLDYTYMSNGGWLIRWQTGTDLKDMHLLGATEENHNNLNWVTWCPGRDSKRTPTVTPTISHSVYFIELTVAYRPVAKRWLCKQRPFR
jgi:hypothetical protein